MYILIKIISIIIKLIGATIGGLSVIIAFEIPGTNADYQTYGVVGCFLLGLSGIGIAGIGNQINSPNNISFTICFTLITLALGVASLLYWNKRKNL